MSDHSMTTENVAAERRVRSSCTCGHVQATGYADHADARAKALHIELRLAGAHLETHTGLAR